MKVAKWGNSLAIRIPADVVRELGIVEGDEVTLEKLQNAIGIRRAITRKEAVDAIRRLAKPLPAGYTFDREEANAR